MPYNKKSESKKHPEISALKGILIGATFCVVLNWWKGNNSDWKTGKLNGMTMMMMFITGLGLGLKINSRSDCVSIYFVLINSQIESCCFLPAWKQKETFSFDFANWDLVSGKSALEQVSYFSWLLRSKMESKLSLCRQVNKIWGWWNCVSISFDKFSFNFFEICWNKFPIFINVFHYKKK